jgi:hypothetical protein
MHHSPGQQLTEVLIRVKKIPLSTFCPPFQVLKSLLTEKCDSSHNQFGRGYQVDALEFTVCFVHLYNSACPFSGCAPPRQPISQILSTTASVESLAIMGTALLDYGSQIFKPEVSRAAWA